jgi:predicted nucleotidyltransferase
MSSRFTPYPELDAVLAELVAGVRGALGDALVGAYLQGSFAVGDFDEHSDVDFIVVARDEPSDAQVAALQTMHARVYDLAWRTRSATGIASTRATSS